MTNPQLPPLPIDPARLAGIDNNRPLNHVQAAAMMATYGAVLEALFVRDPRAAAVIDANVETTPDSLTFTAKLKPLPPPEPDALKAIGS